MGFDAYREKGSVPFSPLFPKDKSRVPALYLECLEFIADVFECDNWTTRIAREKKLLDAVAPNGYTTA